MNVVGYERVCYERFCYERGLFRDEWSVMNRSVLNEHWLVYSMLWKER